MAGNKGTTWYRRGSASAWSASRGTHLGSLTTVRTTPAINIPQGLSMADADVLVGDAILV